MSEGSTLTGMSDLNVLGEPLQPCGTDPMTGYFRDGSCTCADVGQHAVCTVVTAEFLEHQREIGNDLITPRPEFDFPGLQPGDRWCVVASRWQMSYDAGVVGPVVLASTSARALDFIPIEALRKAAVDVPDDPGALL
jgi:uncharacterized protein (DUF2237 family)